MESMAAGVPVVAANVGGNPELVKNGKTGILFASGNEQQFAAALEKLILQPELRKQLGTSGRVQAQAEYAIPQVRDRYQDFFRSQLAEKGWRAPSPLEYLQAAETSQEGRPH
jgi:glycosyltransferase involved in cell wall biosynthesis